MYEDTSSPSERFNKEFFNITLGLLGIIQGLALNQITEKFVKGNESIFSISDLPAMTHFALCFMLILRVFQTYIAGVLDSGGWRVSFFDVIVIFSVGVIQFWAFEALGHGPAYRPHTLHGRLAAFLAIATVLYIVTLVRMRFFGAMQNGEPAYARRQIRLQAWNIALTGLCAATLVCSYRYEFEQARAALVSIALCAVVALNINISLRNTIYT